eukprot:CAMPEP_0196587306 /NCGR_PEP_ID=MMETSP1081-20130531/57067_1 /TAXON_ID=36882 /ORGANISM="Pyramimonas amylifera, Strain CCMP720" /LENGTH=442 /DNA_ID=CAMNT_0041909455 /DNA_START=100 /DNA_END=1428 /DNA_ORIENTATION=-
MTSNNKRNGPSLMQEVILYAVSALFSFAILDFSLKRMDPNRAKSKQASVRKREIAARLGRPAIKTDVFEDIIALDVVNPDQINVNFDAIGGMEDVKKALDELVILPLRRPELFQRGNLLKPVKGVLLYGPPGTGKTMLAKALAKESEACFINVRVSTLQSKWFGDAQKLVTAVFTLAWKLQPSIIFIDEVDSFLGKRRAQEHEAVTNMKTEFMSLWDGFLTDNHARVMVLAATNRPWEVDEAILRRLPQSFEVPLPSKQQRASILDVLLRDEELKDSSFRNFGNPNSALMRLAGATEGYSGSDLQELCKHAAYRPIQDLLEKEKKEREAEGRPQSISRVGSSSTIAGLQGPNLRPLEYIDFEWALKYSRPPAEAAMRYQQSDAERRASSRNFSASRRGVSTNSTADDSNGQMSDSNEEILKQLWLLLQASASAGAGVNGLDN